MVAMGVLVCYSIFDCIDGVYDYSMGKKMDSSD